jgi:hypothetical protein
MTVALPPRQIFGCFAAILATATLASPMAFAADCRISEKVQESTNVAKNTAMGGHLAQHIYGTKKLPKNKLENKDMSYENKSVFKTAADFEVAWTEYLALDKKTTSKFNPQNCSRLAGEGQTVPVAMLTRSKSDSIKGYSCYDATCSDKKRKELDFSKVAFFFQFVKPSDMGEKKKSDDGNWILVTAYPTN